MPEFNYIASDTSGKLIRGQIQAPDKFLASQRLTAQALFILEIKPSYQANINQSDMPKLLPQPPSAARRAQPAGSATDNKHAQRSNPSLPKILTQRGTARFCQLERALYLRQLAIMFGAGIALHRATLRLLQSSNLSTKVLDGLYELQHSIERGRSFSRSLERSGLFTPVITNAIALGEKSGKLYAVLQELASAEERSASLKKELIAKLTYPAFILALLVSGLVLLANFISVLTSSVPSLKAQPPYMIEVVHKGLTSQMLVPTSLLLICLFTLFLQRITSLPKGRALLEQFLFSLPYLGSLLIDLESNRLASYLAMLVKIGYPIDDGLVLCSTLCRSESFRLGLVGAANHIRAGQDLHASLSKAGIPAPSLLALIKAGEESASLDKTLELAARHASSRLRHSIDTTVSVLEPLLICLLGSMIGGILIFTFIPIFHGLQEL